MPKLKNDARRALIEQRQAQILAAAAKVFARKGYERATIADIAKEARLAEGSIYNYFKNKADLLVSIPQQFVRPAVASVSGEMFPVVGSPPPPPAVLLTTVARTLLATVRKNAYIFRILLSALPSLKESAREKYLQNVVMHATGMLDAYFREQIEQGAFRRDLNPVIAARIFIGMFIPFVLLQEIAQVEERTAFDYEQVIANAVRIFLNGALAESDQAKSK